MNDAQAIINALDEHRRETRGDLKELRHATAEMATAVAQLTTTVARVEERHANHDDGIRRVEHRIDNHESRIRDLELGSSVDTASVKIGWKVLTVIGSILVGIAVIAGSLV